MRKGIFNGKFNWVFFLLGSFLFELGQRGSVSGKLCLEERKKKVSTALNLADNLFRWLRKKGLFIVKEKFFFLSILFFGED